MARMTTLRFRRGDREYVLDLHWDNDAFVDGRIAFEIVAGWYPPGESDIREAVSANVRLEPKEDEDSVDLVVEIAGKEVFRDSLAEIFGEESVLGRIPGAAFGLGDPLLGCFVRAGISATVGQILGCKERTVSAEWLWDRLRAIGRCLKENGIRIASRVFLRTGACIVRG